jgi:hypothetical protein
MMFGRKKDWMHAALVASSVLFLDEGRKLLTHLVMRSASRTA